MLTHAVLAAGRGTRMYGSDGGNKAMTRVGEGHLIDYVVREVEPLTPTRTIVLAGVDDHETPTRVRALTASEVSVIPSPSDGTGPGVRRLLGAATGESIALTTCDLAAGAGSLTTFFESALALVSEAQPRCVVAVSPLDDTDPAPIFVHTRDGVVVDYGKKAPRSPLTFAGARLMNSAFATLLLNSSEEFATDTEMMTSVVRSFPRHVRSLVVNDLFDVDHPGALLRAEELTREDRLSSHPPGADGHLRVTARSTAP